MKITNATIMAIGLVLGSCYGTAMASGLSMAGRIVASALLLAAMALTSWGAERLAPAQPAS